ncbi:MAG: DUF3859 domain-containing protein, partial [Gammaproteobacteria bacterium]|nr:DUF3859 domain-containing protein [Gammaproteobacteria bacterium]
EIQGSEIQGSEITETPALTRKPAEAKATSGRVFEYGIYNAQRKGRIVGSLTTDTGKVVRQPVLEFSEATDRIPLIKGTYFAYRYRIIDLPKVEAKKPIVEVRKVLIHPPMTLPDGTTSTGWDRVARARTTAGQVIAFDGYAFNEDYELVQGDWTFQIWFAGKKLLEQTFTTYQPEKSAAIPVAASTAESKR